MNLDVPNEKHVISLLRWLFDEVWSSCGDGDGIWYSKYYKVEHVAHIVKTHILNGNMKYSISDDEKTITYSDDQESLIITNNKELWDKRPSWSQASLHY